MGLHNYCADCSVRFRELATDELAERALAEMHAPVNYKPVEIDGAARAARQILAVMGEPLVGIGMTTPARGHSQPLMSDGFADTRARHARPMAS